MKIKRLGYKNFRAFKEAGEVTFATDGRINIVYGGNGAGKTTMHQLFQWVFYNSVNFNTSSSERMYNTEFEAEQAMDTTFSVVGEVEYIEDGSEYLLRREWVYAKKIFGSSCVNRKITLTEKNANCDWVRVSGDIDAYIEKLIPSGLSKYFFFDGERMITDLKEKSRESSISLRKALYSIFDLNLYEKASRHIGNTDLKTSVIGKLYLSKTAKVSAGNVDQLKIEIENAQQKVESLSEERNNFSNSRDSKKLRCTEISEQIGVAKSKEAYEQERKDLISNREALASAITSERLGYGDDLVAYYPSRLIAKNIIDAKKRMHLQIDTEKLIPGLTKELIDSLLKESKCICDRSLTDNERNKLIEYYKMFPPISNKSDYDNFTRYSEQLLSIEKKDMSQRIKNVLKYQASIRTIEDKLVKLDTDMAQMLGIMPLIEERQKLEKEIRDIEVNLDDINLALSKFELYLRKKKKDFESALDDNDNNTMVERKIKIMQAVKMHFDAQLGNMATVYSKKLCDAIQALLNKMLTAERKVEMSSDFGLKVYDNYGDEYKSEGQFAIVSFAYIGGIFKVLVEETGLKGKEYPLILDGPFSKLDPIQKQNVINTIPNYAPQVILFSKDDLRSCVPVSQTGSVWTIESRDRKKNVASVKEGYDGNIG